LIKIISLSVDYKLQHHFYVSDFLAQLDRYTVNKRRSVMSPELRTWINLTLVWLRNWTKNNWTVVVMHFI